MRWRKLTVSVILTAVVVIDAISLGWSIANNEFAGITIYAISIVFSIYLLGIAYRSVNQMTVELHSESVLHLTVLSTLAVTFLGSTAILPVTPPTTSSLETVPALRIIWHAKLALYMFVCLISFTTAQGPRLCYPTKRIYSEKTIQATTNPDEENVCGIVGELHYPVFRPFRLTVSPSQVLHLGKSYCFHIQPKSSGSATLPQAWKSATSLLSLQTCARQSITPE